MKKVEKSNTAPCCPFICVSAAVVCVAVCASERGSVCVCGGSVNVFMLRWRQKPTPSATTAANVTPVPDIKKFLIFIRPFPLRPCPSKILWKQRGKESFD